MGAAFSFKSDSRLEKYGLRRGCEYVCNSHKCKAPYHILYIIYMRLNSSKPQNKSLKNQKVRKLGTNFSGVVC